MNILVVDDEDLILSLVNSILQKENHNIILAYTGEEALKLLRDNKTNLDLVILDLHMPGLSGPDTLRQMRTIYENLPCIFSSGESMNIEDLPEDIRTNTYYLDKPYRSKELIKKVKEIYQISVTF